MCDDAHAHKLAQLFHPPSQIEIEATFRFVQCIVNDSHIVYSAGDHGRAYVNKDALIPHPLALFRVTRAMALPFVNSEPNIEVVVGPVVGGAILASWIAFHLTDMTGREILSVYADKIDDTHLTFKRGYGELIADKIALVSEDVLNSGGSAARVVSLSRDAGCKVVGVTAICNRGNVTADDLGGELILNALLNVKMEKWPEAECPLCRDGVPINTELGHGRDFLARKAAQKSS